MIKLITKDEVQVVLTKLLIRKEEQLKNGIDPWMIDKKIKSWEKMLDYNYRSRELEFRVATANTLQGYERYKIYQDEVYDSCD